NGAIPLGQYTATVSGIGNNNVVTATISIPDEGYNGLGFRQHPVEPNWDDDEWYEITVTRIKYRRYTVDGFEPIVTFDRFVFLSVAQSTPVKNIRYIIVRSPGGNTFGAGGKDVNVDPEKYYYYSLYYGFMMDVPWGQPVAATRSVKIPSDATDAKASADAAASRTIYNGQSAAYWAYQASLAAQNPAPTITRVQGLNNATCTTGTTFSVVVQAAGATECRAKVDNGAWTGWVPIGSPVMVTGITLTGAHTIYVEARGSTGATATGQMMMFKL
ncbi:MAG: hypothetical protein QMC81_11120, partial [Thermoanaerobacterales bacterium]|nr:hypothetical protein [Thermoanaerobacterales bacterium]